MRDPSGSFIAFGSTYVLRLVTLGFADAFYLLPCLRSSNPNTFCCSIERFFYRTFIHLVRTAVVRLHSFFLMATDPRSAHNPSSDNQCSRDWRLHPSKAN